MSAPGITAPQCSIAWGRSLVVSSSHTGATTALAGAALAPAAQGIPFKPAGVAPGTATAAAAAEAAAVNEASS